MTKSYNSPPEHHVSRHYSNTVTYGTIHSVDNSQTLNDVTYSTASKLLNAQWQNENEIHNYIMATGEITIDDN